jgi:hypothetical protein
MMVWGWFMRRTEAVFFVILLAGCAPSEPSDGVAAETAPPPPMTRHGCIGAKLDACISELRSAIQFDEKSWQREIERRDEIDVSGKPLAGHEFLTVSGTIPGLSLGHTQLNLTLSSSDVVQSIMAWLPSSPFMAHTESEYDDTGLYEVASLIYGDQCSTFNRLGIYRFFNDKVRPMVIHEPTQYNAFGAGKTNSQHAYNMGYCGRSFEYDFSVGESSELITEGNLSGSFANATITVR